MSIEAMQGSIDAGAFWRTLGERPIGATIVTARSGAGPTGFLGLSAAHISADPPMMQVSVDHRTTALVGILEAGHFAINFLPIGFSKMAEEFGRSGPKRFDDDLWETLATGAPVLLAALGVFDCSVDRVVELANTSIVIGSVEALRASGKGDPLVFFRGKWSGE